MAEYTKTEKKQAYEYQYKKDYQEDWALHRSYITTFDPLEAMLMGEVYDSVSKKIDGSKITDSYTTTLAREQADRVVAKLPDGETEAVGRIDVGKAAFMDILRQKWIYPNANAQHKFLEKINMWQFYSSVYGYMPMFYDWNVAATGYVGPDCWLWNPRNLVPQQGRVSINDMDYVTALTWVSKKYLKEALDGKKGGGWDQDALRLLLEKIDNEVSDIDSEKDTRVARSRVGQPTRKGICLATRYEAGFYDEQERPEEGRWCTFAPDHSSIQVREVSNPHKNGRIPFVVKYSQALYDSFYGLGDFQRAKPLQFARDGLTNFYFKGIKMNLIPPVVANVNGVLKHTLDYREGAVMFETVPNSIRRLETSPAGLSTYQGAQSNLTGSLLSLFGSQNASIPGAESLNPSQGKTPAAIKMYSDKEGTRDGSEVRRLEDALEELTDGFFSLVANIGTEDIPINLFSKDIEEIVDSGLKDVLGLFVSNPDFKIDESGTAARLRIKPGALKGVEYRFNINPNSTMKVEKQEQLEKLEAIMGVIGKFQNIFKDDPRIDVNWGEMMKAYEMLSDIKGAEKFITIKDGPSLQEQELQSENQQLQKKIDELQMKAAASTKQPSESINYKDAPEDVKRQMEAQAGLEPSGEESPAGTDQMLKKAQVVEKVAAAGQPQPEAESTTNKTGAYSDKDVGSVAEHIAKL